MLEQVPVDDPQDGTITASPSKQLTKRKEKSPYALGCVAEHALPAAESKTKDIAGRNYAEIEAGQCAEKGSLCQRRDASSFTWLDH